MSKNKDKTTKLEDLDFFYMPNGLPCFLGNRPDLFEIVEEELNMTMYYVLADQSTFKKYTQTQPATYNKGFQEPAKTIEYTEEEREAKIFKVVKNMVGRTVQPTEDSFDGTFLGIEPEAIYNLPPIPMTLINKLDEFFRLVHAQHGTESIVLLTFDESNMSSDSWGVLVPKQENTSVHCKYDPDSVVELKPYNLSIVGSVHSHPEMAAYASGTDHEDQADFDGIHITYGWQKSKDNGATQYHIEMQMAGTAYILKPEDVFENHQVIKDPDPEVVKWTENVSKKAQPPYSGTGVTTSQPVTPYLKNQPTTTATSTQATGAYNPSVGYYRTVLKSIVDFDLPKDAILVVEVDDKHYGTHCPLCEFVLSNIDIANRMCGGCEVHLALPGDSAYEIIENVCLYETEKLGYTTKNYSSIPEFNHIYLHCKDIKGNPMFLHIYDNGKIGTSDVSYLDPIASQDYTLCCNTHIDDIATDCHCQVTVDYEDLTDFETKHPSLDIYDNTSECFECKNYLQPTCPSYRKIVVDWATDNIEVSDHMIMSTCESFFPYLYTPDKDEYLYDDDKSSLYYN